MACGTPVVCSKVASLAEISADVAVFCDPEDPKDIAEKITKTLNIPEKERELLSKKSIKHAAKFSWDKVTEETINVYKTVA